MKFILRTYLLFLYGGSLAVLLLLMKWLEYRFLMVRQSFEIYVGIIALLFTVLGVWLSNKLIAPKTTTLIIEKEIFIPQPDVVETDANEIKKAGLSQRELDVLQLMAGGYSNQEIAERLFVSLNTIKTHTSNILSKLDVKRRTQAVEKAKRLKIIQ